MLTLNNRKRVTIKELALEHEVSERTIARDLQELGELNFPVYSELGRRGGYRVLNDRLLPPVMLSENEAVAIYFACESLKYFGATPFEQSNSTALNKFYTILPGDVRKKVDLMKDKVVYWHPTIQQNSNYLKILLDAAINQDKVIIRYNSLHGSKKRNIYPLGIYSYKGYWFCPAFCCLRRDYRLFRLDRIIEAERQPGSIPKDILNISMDEWLYPKQRNVPIYPLKLTLTEEGVRKCEANLWLRESLKIYEDGTGIIATEFEKEKLTFYTEMIWEFGEHATVKEPNEMIEQLVEKSKRLYMNYTN
jgi:predicted DNA-binding transcriptional regulator YafY